MTGTETAGTETAPAGAQVPPERLEAEICELEGHLSVPTCRWLLLVVEFDRREGWGAWGIASCAHWLSWRCRFGVGAARERVRVARRLGDLPGVTAAFGRGELSYAKVRALTRVATAATEAGLLEVARHATAPQLERIVRAYRRAVHREADEAKRAPCRHEERRVRWHYDDDGAFVLTARLLPEEGALVEAALEAVRLESDAPAADVSMRPPPNRAAGRADALVAVARAALATMAAGADGGDDRGHGVVHVESRVLAGDDGDGACQLRDGPALAPETARRLVHEGGFAVTVGRPGHFVFRRPDGFPAPRVPLPSHPYDPGLARRHRERALAIGPRTCGSLGEGQPFDLALTVDILLAARRRHLRAPAA